MQVLARWRMGGASVLWLICPLFNVLTPEMRCLMDFLLKHETPDFNSGA